MLIFYVKTEFFTYPIVVIDAMSSDDRFSTTQDDRFGTTQIVEAVYSNAPNGSFINPKPPQVYSCEYSAQFEHIGIPLGTSIKTRFSATIKSPPAALVNTFSPKFMTSSKSVEDLENALSLIPNAQMNITYAAFVILGAAGTTIVRKFIVYAAPLYPDPFGTTTTMILSGAMIDDVIIKQATFCQIDKKTPLSSQLNIFLAAQVPAWIGNFDNAPNASSLPATEMLLKPMKFRDFLSEVCLQNKMIFKCNDSTQSVIFYGIGQKNAPQDEAGYKPPKFSFLGSSGYMAWGLGVENYVNIKFKSAIFDPQLFSKIILYNDIKSAFFEGLTKGIPLKKIDSYDAWIIRYAIKWSRTESMCEVTASNNWLMGIIRIDGLLESAIYTAAGGI